MSQGYRLQAARATVVLSHITRSRGLWIGHDAQLHVVKVSSCGSFKHIQHRPPCNAPCRCYLQETPSKFFAPTATISGIVRTTRRTPVPARVCLDPQPYTPTTPTVTCSAAINAPTGRNCNMRRVSARMVSAIDCTTLPPNTRFSNSSSNGGT